MSVTEGFVDFKHPTLPDDIACKTWYKVVGDLKSGKRPLVALHGGPGCTHIYLTVPFEQYPEKTGRPVVLYDQIGCGKNTHLRSKRLDESFWTEELFVAELDNLLRHLGIRDDFDLFGHSWGAMLSAVYAVSDVARESGLHKLVLGSGPARMTDWVESGAKLVADLPEAQQETIRKYSSEGKYDAPEYQEALKVVYEKHVCRKTPWPKEVIEAFHALEEDDTTYMTMQGPDEITVLGSLKNYDMSEKCKDIIVPTLVIYGEYDQCSDECVKPFVDGIKDVKSVKVPGAGHMVGNEQPEKYLEIISEFLLE